MMTSISNGDLLFLIYDHRRCWLKKVISNQEFHTDKGFIRYNEIIGKNFGETAIIPPNNNKISLFKPLPSDIVLHMRRESQIIYPEDIGLILTYGGVIPGLNILEAGVGSGTVTGIMGLFCHPTGHIYSYDIRDIAIKQSQKNLDMMGVSNQCTVEFADICKDALNIPPIDFIMLDLAIPWLAIPKVFPYLKPEGRICSFSPTIEQVWKVNQVMEDAKLHNIIHMELIKRTWQIKPNASRPDTRMIGHTGYFTFASKGINPLPPMKYIKQYLPENIGFILIYAGIVPGNHILVISETPKALQDILADFLGSNTLIECRTPKELQKLEISNNVAFQLEWKDKFNVVILDQLTDVNIEGISPWLKFSGTICALGHTIDQMKQTVAGLHQNSYYDINTYELILRQIFINPNVDHPESVIQGTSGYITIGRRLNDIYPRLIKSQPTGEVVENLVDVAKDIKDIEQTEEKIDYTELSPEEQDEMDRKYMTDSKN